MDQPLHISDIQQSNNTKQNKLTLLTQGNCSLSADGFNASCVCSAGWSGANCNLRTTACQSSPCRNGGACRDVPAVGGFACNCTDEYEGVACETAKRCVQSFDYCSSMPCLNGGTCTPLRETCAFSCQCDSAVSYGQFCQFSIAPNVYTGRASVSLVSMGAGIVVFLHSFF